MNEFVLTFVNTFHLKVVSVFFLLFLSLLPLCCYEDEWLACSAPSFMEGIKKASSSPSDTQCWISCHHSLLHLMGMEPGSPACCQSCVLCFHRGTTLMFLSFFPRELRAGQLAAQQGCRSTPEHAGSQRDVIITPRGHELLQPLSSTWPQVVLCSCSEHSFFALQVLLCVLCDFVTQTPACAVQQMGLRLS